LNTTISQNYYFQGSVQRDSPYSHPQWEYNHANMHATAVVRPTSWMTNQRAPTLSNMSVRIADARLMVEFDRDEAELLIHNLGISRLPLRAMECRLVIYLLALMLVCVLSSYDVLLTILLFGLASVATWHAAVHISFPLGCGCVFTVADIVANMYGTSTWTYRSRRLHVFGTPLWLSPLWTLTALCIADMHRCSARVRVRRDTRIKRGFIGEVL